MKDEITPGAVSLARLTFVAALLAGASLPARAQETAADVAAKFGALESVSNISLSPDGSKVAAIMPIPGGSVLVISRPGKDGGRWQGRPISRANGENSRLQSCRWSTDTRLICRMGYIANDGVDLLGFSRSFALDVDGSHMEQLTVRDSVNALQVMQHGGTVLDWDVGDKPGVVLMTRQFVSEKSTGTRLAADTPGLAVEEVDTITLKRTVIESPREDAAEYISDGRGKVRVMGMVSKGPDGMLRNKYRYLYRQPGSRTWQALSQTTMLETTGFEPAAVDSTSNVTYGFEPKDGYKALYSLSLDGTAKKTLLLSRPDVDIDGLIRIGRDGRVVGATYATERREAEFFDPVLKRLGTALGKALPDQPIVRFIDASAGETKLLLEAGSDTDPGAFYLFDKATRQLDVIGAVRPELEGRKLAPMKPVQYPAADGTMIPAYLTLPVGSDGKNLPAIVMPHGGPSARDEWGFDWLVQFYAARGFAVIQPNYRGSSGYGSAWYQKNGFRSWRIAIGDVNDAGKWLVSQGIAASGKLAILGWSYGGYAALQTSVVEPDLFKAIVAIAPVTDLEMLRAEYANFTNADIVIAQIGTGEHVAAGSPAQHARTIKAPVMLFHGNMDQNVRVTESRVMADRLRSAGKSVTYVEFPGLDHYLTDAPARTRLLQESDAFLRKELGITP